MLKTPEECRVSEQNSWTHWNFPRNKRFAKLKFAFTGHEGAKAHSLELISPIIHVRGEPGADLLFNQT
jgi:hypothetical protein